MKSEGFLSLPSGSLESHRDCNNVCRHPNIRCTKLGVQGRAGYFQLEDCREKVTDVTWNKAQHLKQHTQKHEGDTCVM